MKNDNLKFKIIFFCLIFLSGFLMWENAQAGSCWNGSYSGTNPWTVLDGSGGNPSAAFADVEYCVNHVAANGDTINVTATGEVIWPATTLRMDKAVHLNGPGADNLTIKAGTYSQIKIHPNSTGNFVTSYAATKDYIFRISNFKFDSMTYYRFIEIGNQALDPGFDMQTVVIDHNKFIHSGTPGSGGYAIWDRGTAYGVVYHNIFGTAGQNDGRYPIKTDGGHGRSSTKSWFGTSGLPQSLFDVSSEKFLYFEDNVFNLGYDGTSGYGVTDGQFSARQAYRYNTMNAQRTTGGMWELHGEANNVKAGSYIVEDHVASHGGVYYGNDIQAGIYYSGQFKTRSGQTILAFNNTTSSYGGTWPGNNAYVDYLYEGLTANGGEYPFWVCPDFMPEEKIQHDSYWFRNYRNKNQTLIDVSGTDHAGTSCPSSNDCMYCIGLTKIPTVGRDVIGDATSPASVGCGTLANRPTTCVEHDGYWATSQTELCSNLTGYVGADTGVAGGGRILSNKISGTLYKCDNANNWSVVFTPYAYPHPLRNESPAADTNAPASPTGLSVN